MWHSWCHPSGAACNASRDSNRPRGARQFDLQGRVGSATPRGANGGWSSPFGPLEPGDPDAGTWVAAQAIKVLDGNAAQVAAGIRRRATTYGYSAREREGADTCANYLTAKRPYLDYATALKSGWPIATGVIEGACRHIPVKDRMDITGARWGLDSAEAVLKLRALDSNGDFGAYCIWHLEQEQQRIHYARYKDPSILAA